ncbi:YezD family protein [Metabacillus arenae]|uniref:YezD family protein n=1 Tax=Metabacillus arenae TaxID=2771434 RepID=A0A926NNI7_9BACI|nr:YezD family protein [Metabacillus arenae]MBD1381066.1 YezD family protein [Metabacillus arenae]
MANLSEAKTQHILSALKQIEYGSLLITVHDGEITQIDRTEKNRFLKTKVSQSKRKANGIG